MAKIAKKYAEAIKKVDREKRYDMEEALDLLPQMTYAKFDETVEIALRLGVDPRHSDQMVRGSVALPNGLGKKVRVLVFAKGQKEKEAEVQGKAQAPQGGDHFRGKTVAGIDGFLIEDDLVPPFLQKHPLGAVHVPGGHAGHIADMVKHRIGDRDHLLPQAEAHLEAQVGILRG